MNCGHERVVSRYKIVDGCCISWWACEDCAINFTPLLKFCECEEPRIQQVMQYGWRCQQCRKCVILAPVTETAIA